MAQSQAIVLDDSKVSRMVAAKAANNRLFKKELRLYYYSAHLKGETRKSRKLAQPIVSAIAKFRLQLAEQAGLRAPKTWSWLKSSSWTKQDLNTYLKPTKHSRGLVAKGGKRRARTISTGWDTRREEIEDAQWGWVGTTLCIAGIALAHMESESRFKANPTPFPFERLPTEIRLQVYREALNGTLRGETAFEEIFMVTRNKKNVFHFRYPHQKNGESKDINTSLLRVSKLVNSEAVPVFYQSHTFDFAANVRNIEPVLYRLPEAARHTLQGIRVDLRDGFERRLCRTCIVANYGGDNQAAWIKACKYIAAHFKVKQLHLTINARVEGDFKSLKWVKALIKVKSLQRLTLTIGQQCSHHPLLPRGSYTDGMLMATDNCFDDNLTHLFEYLLEEMVGGKVSRLLPLSR